MSAQPAHVVDLDDFRRQQEQAQPAGGGGKCAITFYTCKFNLDRERRQSLSWTIIVEPERFQELIDAARARGGVWLPPDVENETGWFIPWPPAAIAIRPYHEEQPPGGNG